MATTIKGQATCPECGSVQEVKHDGRKYYISCTECRTFTNYQSAVAKARIENRLTPLAVQEKPETTEKTKETGEPKKAKEKPKPTPTPVRTPGGFFDAFNELF